MKDRILRLPEVMRCVGLSRGSIYFLMGNDEFPKSIKIKDRATGWVESEVEKWIEDVIKKNRGEAQ